MGWNSCSWEHHHLVEECVSVAQTLRHYVLYSLPGSSVHGILQARILQWIVISFSRDLPDSGIKPRSLAFQADSLPSEPPGKPPVEKTHIQIDKPSYKVLHFMTQGLSRWLSGKESACQRRRHLRLQFNPWVGKILWRRKWQPIPVFLSAKSHNRGAWLAPVHGITKSQTCTQVPYIQTFKFQTFKNVNMHSISIRCEWICSLFSISYCWRSFSSTISHLLSLLQEVTLLACSLSASLCMPAVVLYCGTFQGSVL